MVTSGVTIDPLVGQHSRITGLVQYGESAGETGAIQCRHCQPIAEDVGLGRTSNSNSEGMAHSSSIENSKSIYRPVSSLHLMIL